MVNPWWCIVVVNYGGEIVVVKYGGAVSTSDPRGLLKVIAENGGLCNLSETFAMADDLVQSS